MMIASKRIFLMLPVICMVGFLHAKTITVAKDGSGDYTAIQTAINAIRAFSPEPVTLFIKAGIYTEKLVIPTWITNLTIIGGDVHSTVISWNDYSGKEEGMHTFNTYSVLITGSDIRVENVTFENNAGPVGQAVALHVEGDRVAFFNCRFLGDQDTVYLGRGGSRQLFVKCYIEGTTDFIFGPSTAVFKDCVIHSKRNSYITAASTPQDIEFGYVFIDCKLTAHDEVNSVYLGRPWRNYAKTVFINCEMGPHIRSEGWHNWNRTEAESSVFYAEYGSFGEGAGSVGRVAWSRQLTQNQTQNFTIENVLKDFNY